MQLVICICGLFCRISRERCRGAYSVQAMKSRPPHSIRTLPAHPRGLRRVWDLSDELFLCTICLKNRRYTVFFHLRRLAERQHIFIKYVSDQKKYMNNIFELASLPTPSTNDRIGHVMAGARAGARLGEPGHFGWGSHEGNCLRGRACGRMFVHKFGLRRRYECGHQGARSTRGGESMGHRIRLSGDDGLQFPRHHPIQSQAVGRCLL
jgi:hypothetical protein